MRGDTHDGPARDGAAAPAAAGDLDLAAVFAALPGVELVLAPDAPRYTMLAATEGRLAATMTTREGTLGRPLFEVFPDANPANAAASGVGNLRSSLDTVLRTRAPHRMAVQRYDLQRPDGTWEERYWAPLNLPVLGPDGAVRYLVHRVEDVTESVRLAAEGDLLRGAVAGSERARARAEAARDVVAAAHAQLQAQALALELANQQLEEQAAELEAHADALRAAAGALAERTAAAERALADLAASEARFRTVQDASPLGFAIHRPVRDADGAVVDFVTPYINAAGARIVGQPRERVMAERLLAIWPAAGAEGILADYARVLATGAPNVRELLYEHAELAAGLTLTAVCIGAGAAAEVGVTFTDVTARLRADAERARLLAESEAARASAEAANRAKGEFLAVMSHELRTPLNAIGGYAELIELGLHGPVTDAQRTALARIQASQRHLLGLIAAVLDYSRVEAGAVTYRLADVPVAEAVAEAEALVAPQLRARGLGYAWSGAPPGLRVRADREKLQQVLLNLLGNAIKFTDVRGGVPGWIEVACTVETVVGAAAEAAVPGRVQLHVRDTGHGIAAEQLERMFEPFVQADQRLTRPHSGVGLGLAISRDLARGMGGDLTAESIPGVGSTFTLTLPAGSGPAA